MVFQLSEFILQLNVYLYCVSDASGTVRTQERHAELRRATRVQSGDLWLAEEVSLFLCATPNDFNSGEPRHDHLDPQSYELHNCKYGTARLHVLWLGQGTSWKGVHSL